MTKEELQEYARENRKRLAAQEVKLGDVVKVLIGQFAGEAGTVVGISVIGEDYADPYYEVNMNCEVPERYKCRKTLVTPNNIIGGLSASDFEVIGNRAPMPKNNEIKVGDKVRVSKDAPRMYIGGIDFYFTKLISVVKDIDDGNAALKCEKSKAVLSIPTKYLVKVEEEKPKIKVGDRVRIDPETAKTLLDLPEPYRNLIYEIMSIDGSMAIAEGFGQQIYLPLSKYILVEPKAQTEEKKHNFGAITIPVKVDLDETYWEAYASELAKEVAVKIANKYTDVEKVAEDAVKLAKSVVENLKKK